LDFAGRPARWWRERALVLAVLLIRFALPSASHASQQDSPPATASTQQIPQLFEQERWLQIVHALEPLPDRGPDLDYYYGTALAHLGRWDGARKVLLAGHRLAPRDKRFPLELAGVAFKQKRYSEAATWLRRGLRTDPADAYANDFLGTVYFLQGNVEAALKYWNRIRRPQIESLRPEHPLRIRAALLDRALTFAPASPMLLPDLLTSRERVEGLGVFSATDLRLAARADAKFDVVLNLQERNGWGNNRWLALLSMFRGAAYETVYPEYFNLGRSAMNVTSLVRFDAQKRRLAVDLSAPLHQDPKWRYRVGVDLRNENWEIRDSFTGPAPLLAALNLRREAASAEITSINSGRWGWSAGAELSHRDYRSVNPSTVLTSSLLLQGMQLKQVAQIHYEVWRVPERRLNVRSGASSQLARIWSEPAEAFAKLQGSVSSQWFPKSEGDDYETQVQLRGGGTAGTGPFDELFMLGMERDNDLWLRAHVGTRDGRKGSAPLGRRYFLVNSETDKKIYGNGIFSIKLSPFLDTGRVTDSSLQLASQKWLWDTGVQTKMRVLGMGVTFIFGKDLRSGTSAFYFTTFR
jgi:tetratricopeptide (TPR) repeat protein